jgi:hypothetical protein
MCIRICVCVVVAVTFNACYLDIEWAMRATESEQVGVKVLQFLVLGFLWRGLRDLLSKIVLLHYL